MVGFKNRYHINNSSLKCSLYTNETCWLKESILCMGQEKIFYGLRMHELMFILLHIPNGSANDPWLENTILHATFIIFI